MLRLVMTQKALGIAMQQRSGGDHLGIEEGVMRQLPEKEAAMPIGPIHHRRHAEAAGRLGARGCWVLAGFRRAFGSVHLRGFSGVFGRF
ncbi:hypothetical protein ACE0DR_00875 [Azotobacter sp. CWF10]